MKCYYWQLSESREILTYRASKLQTRAAVATTERTETNEIFAADTWRREAVFG